MTQVSLKEDDFRFEWYSGQGKGGQHRNKHQNCCRCIHEPTGIRAHGTSSKSRETNKRNALSVCKSRVVDYFSEDEERFKAGFERVRTYHEPDNRVVDHRSGYTESYKSVVGNNDLSSMITARRKASA